jgi:two-component system osmolarity sensor histidine kinase EnvZ
MSFAWLKKFMPRSLYGRAALILILPVVVLQLAVSVVFVQRHFSGVTHQMTRNIIFELGFIFDQIETAPTMVAGLANAGTSARPLGMEIDDLTQPIVDARVWFDFTGITVLEGLHTSELPVTGVDLITGGRDAIVGLASRHGPVVVRFHRERVSASNPHQLLVLSVMISVLMTVIAFIFLRNQLRPIKRLARAASAFGRGQSASYKPSGAVEVREAGQSFLNMRNRIERHIEQRTLMLSGVSHDLRTPLTRLRLELAMLPEAESADMLRDVDEMRQMLDEFLNFARAGAVDAEETVDLAEFITHAVEDSVRHGGDVTLNPLDGTIELQIRAGAVRRAVDNLIGNALRYGDKAVVSVLIMDKSIRITVEDDGPGIPEERREEALRPFTRLESSRNQNKGAGVGLGLAITNDIARSHGGVLRLGQSAKLGGLQADLELSR